MFPSQPINLKFWGLALVLNEVFILVGSIGNSALNVDIEFLVTSGFLFMLEVGFVEQELGDFATFFLRVSPIFVGIGGDDGAVRKQLFFHALSDYFLHVIKT